MDNDCFTTQVIDKDGSFNPVALENFIDQIKLKEYGLSYAVVAIIGRQSSGKSTLLNNLFHTNFIEMDAYKGRSQTTKGIWTARYVNSNEPSNEPCTIVMDLEGTDGREREDDTAFEKQSALFALAVSDILLINIWCHDIGSEQAANRPLLKTVFQEMLKLSGLRKTTLMFVIRDKTKTPVDKLEDLLMKDIQKMWDSLPKPEAHKQTPLSKFFNVLVRALSSYEREEEQFKEQVVNLRETIFNSIATVAADRREVVPASGFSFSTQQIWQLIKENKNLDLPAHKVMVATVRCNEIAYENYSSFVANKEWIELKEAVQSHLVPGFGNKLSSLLCNCLSSYDKEAFYFEDSVRSEKKRQLEDKLLQLVQPAHLCMLKHIRSGTLDSFKKTITEALNGGQGFAVAARDCTTRFMGLFDEQCKDAAIKQANWDLAKVRDKFSCKIDSHIDQLRTSKLSELTALYESKLKEALYGPVESLLKGGTDDTWPAIRQLLCDETGRAEFEFSSALSGFEMDEEALEDMKSKLKKYGRGVVEGKTREEAEKVLYRLKERFTFVFSHDNDLMPRFWTGKEDIGAITKTALSSSLKLLSVLAAIRLDEHTDTIWDMLERGTSNIAAWQNSLDSSTWKEVPATQTLITPVQCKWLWSQFLREIKDLITQAITSQEATKRYNHKCNIKKDFRLALTVLSVVIEGVRLFIGS